MRIVYSLLFIVSIAVYSMSAQSTEFTYQGSLRTSSGLANGNYDFEFSLYDAESGGAQLGQTLVRGSVPVVDGVFTVKLNFAGFAGQFSGPSRYLEITVRQTGGGAFTPLTPRQLVSSAPYAIKSLVAENAISSTNATNATNATTAATATNALQLGGVAANQYVTTTNGNATYIQNSTSQQGSSNFNITGTGSADTLNFRNQLHFNGAPLLNLVGTSNMFMGLSTLVPTSQFQTGNTIFGNQAGIAQSLDNYVGNSMFGNTTGRGVSGTGNSFFGNAAGNNAASPIIAADSTLIGNLSNLTAVNNGTAIGFRAMVTRNNSVVLGSINGVNGANADTNVGIGTTAPLARLSVFGGGFGANALISDNNPTATTIDLANTSTNGRTWRFQSLGSGDATRVGNLELWNVGGANALGIQPNGNVGIGTVTPSSRLHVAGGVTVNGPLNYFATSGNANFFMKGAGSANGINFGVAANVGSNSTLYISQYDGTTYQDRFILTSTGSAGFSGNVGIGLPVLGSSNNRLDVNGTLGVWALGSPGTTPLCWNSGTFQISNCSSSLKYKTNILQFSQGLSFVNRLRPISFDWKDGGMKDIGFGAEDIAKIDPRFVTYNDKGEVEGVKYDRIGVVLVNAVKEQQAQIEAQDVKIKSLEMQLEAFKVLVCSQNPSAEVCRLNK